jgi:tRNA (cmo5U34)-methyltransferase
VATDMLTDPAGSSREWQDHEVAQWIKFDAERVSLLRWAASLLPFPPDAPIRVLDVGTGHGPFASEILARYAASRVCLQDFSEAMLREAADRLAWARGRFDFHRSDLRDPDWPAHFCSLFDAAVSAAVIHTLDRQTIRRLYADIVGLLRPAGCFVNVDLILQPPESSVIAGIHHAAGAASFSHHQEDDDGHGPSPTLEEHLRWLREAGFGEVDCIWKQGRQVLLCSVRAGPTRA